MRPSVRLRPFVSPKDLWDTKYWESFGFHLLVTLGTSFNTFFEQPDCEFESFMLDATTKHAKKRVSCNAWIWKIDEKKTYRYSKINTLTHFILSGFKYYNTAYWRCFSQLVRGEHVELVVICQTCAKWVYIECSLVIT